jgi:hypothetical protein
MLLRSRRWMCPTRHSFVTWRRAQRESLAGTVHKPGVQLNQQFVITPEQLEQIRQLRAVPEPEQLTRNEIR